MEGGNTGCKELVILRAEDECVRAALGTHDDGGAACQVCRWCARARGGRICLERARDLQVYHRSRLTQRALPYICRTVAVQDRVVVVVCNLKPAKMRDVMSYGMVGAGRLGSGSGWVRVGSGPGLGGGGEGPGSGGARVEAGTGEGAILPTGTSRCRTA